jgi:Ni/Co efflux regulator RcnB
MNKSLYASVAVLALVLASPALAQRDDNKDENTPRAGHVSRDSDTDKNKPNEQNRERPPPASSPTSPTVSPNGTMGSENGGKPQPSGTMGTTRHERGTMRPGTMTAPTNTSGTTAPRTGKMAPRTGTSAPPTGRIGTGPHVHNPAFNSMRRVTTASQRFHIGTYVRPSGFYVHRWTFGEFLPAFFFTSNYWILDWGNFYLDAPPPGTIWVRVGDDALLIDEYSGEVIEVVYGIFY